MKNEDWKVWAIYAAVIWVPCLLIAAHYWGT